MAKIVKPKTLNKDNGYETFKKGFNNISVAGKKVRRTSNRTKLDKAYKKMSKDLTIQKQSAVTTDNMLGLQILHAMGCSVYDGSANMSLLSAQTDVEVIENEYIFDTQSVRNLRNSIVEPEDKFSNTDSDPFYTLDDSLPITIATRNENIKEETEFKVAAVAANVINQNFSSFGTTTKQFK